MSVNVIIFTDMGLIPFSRASGAYRIATELRKHGYTVQVIDHFLLLGLTRTCQLLEHYVGADTLMVGFSTTFMDWTNLHYTEQPSPDRFNPDLSMRSAIRPDSPQSYGIPIASSDLLAIKNKVTSLNSKTKLVMGGTKSDYHAQKEIDAFIIGYGDKSVIAYLKYLEGKNPFFTFNKTADGRVLIDKDVDASGFDFGNSVIDWHASDAIEPGEVLSIEVSRGCIFKCKFCGFRLNGKDKMDYLKSTTVLRDELMSNYERYGTTRYVFTDDTYNDSTKKLETLGNVFAKLPFKLEFVSYIRLDLINAHREQADILKESGLKSAIFGIETLHHPAGKIIGKGLAPEKTRETLTWLRDEKGWSGNVMMTGCFIIGLPTETQETIYKWTQELMKFDYPLDAFITYALGIVPGKQRVGKSDFDMNHQQYGYKFNSKGWYTDTMTEGQAVKIAMDVMKYAFASGRQKVTGFLPLMMHNYAGTTWEKLHGQPFFQNHIWTLESTNAMVSRYYDKLMTQ